MATTLTAAVRHEVAAATANDPQGRISSVDARKIRATGLDAVRESQRPKQTLAATTRVIAGAMQQPMSDATRAYLGRFAKLGAAEVSGAAPAVPSPLAERVRQALQNSFGATGATIGATTVQAGQTFVELSIAHPLGPVSARVQLAEDAQGRPAVGTVSILSAPAIRPAEPPPSPFVYSESAARRTAIEAITRHTQALAVHEGPAAHLEVWLRTGALVPSALERIDRAEDSAIGLEPGEVQFKATRMWGDISVFYTVNKSTGVAHTNDFN